MYIQRLYLYPSKFSLAILIFFSNDNFKLLTLLHLNDLTN